MRDLRILFAPASGPQVGGGHVMRCAALATALRDAGCACDFAVAAEGEAILSRFHGGGFGVHRAPRGDVEALAALVDSLYPAAAVFDDYGIDEAIETRLAAPGRVLMAVDDLADRRHAVDLLVDSGYGRDDAAYAALAPDAERLLGPRYALLRPAFAKARTAPSTGLDRLFVSFGLSDVGRVAERAVGLIRTRAPTLPLDVVLGADAASLPALEARTHSDAALALHVNATDVAALMAGADAAVGAGGSGVWERCAAGLPSLAVIVADNQRPLVGALADEGATLACDLYAPDFEAAFSAGLDALQDPWRRDTLSAKGRALCDGRGAARVAEALLAAVRRRSSGPPAPSPGR